MRGTTAAVLAGALLLGASRGARAEEGVDLPAVDRSLARAAAWLVAAQSDDGAWRSRTYAILRDGPPLTPYVMSVLWFLPGGERGPGRAAWRKGHAYLAGLFDEEGRLEVGPFGLPYPVYTAASASRMAVLEDRSPANLRVQRLWLDRIRERHMTEALGWAPGDVEYGGWGYSPRIPRKPAAGVLRPPLLTPNLSATLFGIAALRSARMPAEDPVWRKTLAFVVRCQNFAGKDGDARFDDGGFFFTPDDDVLNKAGVAGEDRDGRKRYRSYGTMTADGVRALLQCGLARDHPRVTAARRWLETRFTAARNPGEFPESAEARREGTYYYWVWSVTHAFARLGVDRFERDGKPVDWARETAAELIARQRDDGTWVNPYTEAKEDDPLVATPWAAAALALCREAMAR